MFRLSHKQVEQLEDALTQSQQQRVLRAAAARWRLPRDEVAQQFAGDVGQALALGFVNDADIGAYLDLAREHGDDFPQQPSAAPFFTKLPVDHPAGTLMYLHALAAAQR